MIKRLMWTIWTPISSVLKKADKLNLSLYLSVVVAPVIYKEPWYNKQFGLRKLGSRSWWCIWNFHHWLHLKLSFWQLPMLPVMKISSKLTHWGRVTHICVSRLTIIGSDNGLSPDRRQAIIWTNVGLLLIGPLGTNFSEIVIEILTFSFKKMRLKVSSAKRRPFCLGRNVLRHFRFSVLSVCNEYTEDLWRPYYGLQCTNLLQTWNHADFQLLWKYDAYCVLNLTCILLFNQANCVLVSFICIYLFYLGDSFSGYPFRLFFHFSGSFSWLDLNGPCS